MMKAMTPEQRAEYREMVLRTSAEHSTRAFVLAERMFAMQDMGSKIVTQHKLYGLHLHADFLTHLRYMIRQTNYERRTLMGSTKVKPPVRPVVRFGGRWQNFLIYQNDKTYRVTLEGPHCLGVWVKVSGTGSERAISIDGPLGKRLIRRAREQRAAQG